MGSSLTKLFSTPQHGWKLAAFIAGALIIGGILLMLLTTVPARYRKSLVAVITFIAGLFYSLEFLIPPAAWHLHPTRNPLTEARPFMAQSVQVIWAFALFLGVWNLFEIHGKAVAKHAKGWYNSGAFFAAFFSILITGLLKANSKPADDLYTILFSGFMVSLDATMFSLIAFYIVSAAFRSFKIRSTESIFMMVAAAIVMLALVPVGVFITSWLPQTGFLSIFRLEKIGYWLLIWPNMAVQRAIGFGVAVGALAMGLRIWLSLERGSFFDRQL
jgi:hypothetical protein